MLFNETIKQNIKFGDLSATDSRVLSSAIQANALAFIMQNDEDYTSPSVKLRVTEQFMQLVQEPRLQGYSKVKSMIGLT